MNTSEQDSRKQGSSNGTCKAKEKGKNLRNYRIPFVRSMRKTTSELRLIMISRVLVSYHEKMGHVLASRWLIKIHFICP